MTNSYINFRLIVKNAVVCSIFLVLNLLSHELLAQTTFCVGDVSSLSIPRNIGCSFGQGFNVTWDGASGGTINDPGGSSSSFTVTWTAAGTFRLKRTFPAGCTGTPLYSPYYTIVAQPATPTAGEVNQQPGCGQVTLNYTGSAVDTYWQTSSIGTDQTYRTTRVVTSSGTYFARVKSAAGCWSVGRSVTVSTIITPVGGVLSGSGNFVGSVNKNLTLTGHSGNVLEYRYKENGGSDVVVPNTTTTLPVSFSNPTSLPVSREYWAVVTLNGCQVNSSSTTLTLSGLPAPSMTVCVGQTTSHTITRNISCVGDNATFAIGSGGTINDPGGTVSDFSVTWTTPGTYTLKRSFPSPCNTEIAGQTIIVSANPANAPPNPVAISSCQHVNLVYNGAPMAGEEWHWQGANSNGYAINNNPSYPVYTVGTYYFRTRNAAGCWSSQSSSISIGMANFDWVPPIPSIFYECMTDGLNLTLKSDNVNDRWYTTPSSPTPLAATNTIIVSRNPAIFYLERIVSGNCTFRTPFEIDASFEIKCGSFLNSIKTTKPIEPADQVYPSTFLNKSVTYIDGIGRPVQEIGIKGSPLEKDVVQPIVYDENGRESIKYLPFVSVENNGLFKNITYTTSGNYSHNFYNSLSDKVADDIAPFAITTFEPSPLNRVIKQGSPGSAWQPNADPNSLGDKTIKKRYEFNLANDVLLWTYNSQTNSASAKDGNGVFQYYGVNQLYVNKTYDEDNHVVIEFVDKEGRTILKRVQADDNAIPTYANTYYVYDDFGNLVLVLPPEAVKALTN